MKANIEIANEVSELHPKDRGIYNGLPIAKILDDGEFSLKDVGKWVGWENQETRAYIINVIDNKTAILSWLPQKDLSTVEDIQIREWESTEQWMIDFDKVHSIEDIKAILEFMKITFHGKIEEFPTIFDLLKPTEEVWRA